MTAQSVTMPFQFNAHISIEGYQQLWKKELQMSIDTFEALKRVRTHDILGYPDDLNSLDILEGRTDVRGHVWKNYHPNPDFRKEAEEAARAFSKHTAEIRASSEIAYNLLEFEAAAIVDDPDLQRLLEEWKRELKQGGAFLNDNSKATVQSLTVLIQDEITAFLNNIRNDERYLDLNPEDLLGLPEDFLASRPADSHTGTIRISSKFADVRPILEFCLSQEVRKKTLHMVQTKASPQNEAVLKRLIGLRHEKATLLGYSHWAEYQLEHTMVKTPDAAFAFLQTVFEAVELQADQEKAELAQILQEQGHGDLAAWNLHFGLTLLKKQRLGGFDVKATRQYFPVRKVFPALQKIAERLFSLRFRAMPLNSAWHPSVTRCFVYDSATGRDVLIGQLFFDIFTREAKVDGACCTVVRPPIEGVQLAEVILNANMPPQENACISYQEVKVILHELGHCVHALLAKQRHARFAGITCEMDFVEAPSQMLELWLSNEDLFDFAINEEGKKIPDSVLRQLIAAQAIGRGINERGQICISKFALDLHASGLPANTSTTEIVSRAADLYGVFPLSPGTSVQHSLPHLAAANYASRYYCYIFSQVVCIDMFTEFSKAGDLFRGDVASRYRKHVLEKGGSEDAEDMVTSFLGRRYNIDAYKAWLYAASAENEPMKDAPGVSK